MPRTITTNQIVRIQSIIDELDATLAREQGDRVDWSIETASPDEVKYYKNLVETYKSQFRRDTWMGRFVMKRDGSSLKFQFNSLSAGLFKIVKPPVAGEFRVVKPAQDVVPNDPVMVDLGDSDVSMRVLMESPDVLVLNPLYLDARTLGYLRGDVDSEETALARTLARNGYKWTVGTNRVRVYKP